MPCPRDSRRGAFRSGTGVPSGPGATSAPPRMRRPRSLRQPAKIGAADFRNSYNAYLCNVIIPKPGISSGVKIIGRRTKYAGNGSAECKTFPNCANRQGTRNRQTSDGQGRTRTDRADGVRRAGAPAASPRHARTGAPLSRSLQPSSGAVARALCQAERRRLPAAPHEERSRARDTAAPEPASGPRPRPAGRASVFEPSAGDGTQDAARGQRSCGGAQSATRKRRPQRCQWSASTRKVISQGRLTAGEIERGARGRAGEVQPRSVRIPRSADYTTQLTRRHLRVALADQASLLTASKGRLRCWHDPAALSRARVLPLVRVKRDHNGLSPVIRDACSSST